MKLRVVTLAIALLPLLAQANKEVNETLDAAADGLVDITNTRGEIEVIGWGENTVRVEGELDSLTEEFIFESRGNRIVIEVKIPEKNANWGSGSDLVIHVPEMSRVSFDGVSSDGSFEKVGSGLRVRTVSGDVQASQIQEQVYIKTVSGDIDVQESAGQTNVSSVSGEIALEVKSVQESAGQTNVSSVSGEIALEVKSDRVSIDTVSGDIDAEVGEFERLYVNAVSGDVEIDGALADRGEIDMNSVSGDITLTLDEPVNARLSISTGPGGDISNRLTKDRVKKEFPAMNSLHGESGNGSGEINIRTITGDISLDSD